MGKLEKKIELIKKYLPRCNSVYKCYTYGTIPREQFNNACKNYAGYVPYEKALGMIDETLFDNGKKGMLFTDTGVYVDGRQSIMKYADGCKFSSLPSSYNITVLNELLMKLCDIENELTGWDIAGSLLGAVFEGVLTGITEELSNSAVNEELSQVAIECDDENEFFDDYIDEDDSGLIESYIENLENLMCEALVCDEEQFIGNVKQIINIIEKSGKEEGLIDQIIISKMQSNNEAEIQEINLIKSSKKFINKMKFYISAITDSEGDETEEILEAKKIIRRHAKLIDAISEKLEEVDG